MSSASRLPRSGADLQRAVVQKYPHPIASVYSTLTKARSPSAQALPLVHLYESLIHYLATVAASAYLRSELADASMNATLYKRLLSAQWTTGQIHGLLRDLLKAIRRQSIPLPYPELLGYFLDKREDKRTGDTILGELVELRNVLIHAGDGSDRYCEPRIRQYREVLDRELSLMPWLERGTLLRPIDIEGKQVRSVQLLNGRDAFEDDSNKVRFPLDPADVGHELAPIRPDRDSMVLRTSDGSLTLPLSPLVRFRLDPTEAAFFLQGAEWDITPGKPPRLKRANYVAYVDEQPHLKDDPSEPMWRLLAHHVQRLHEAVTPDVREEVKPTVVVDETPADPDFTLVSVLNEQNTHLKGFVGRRSVLDEWHAWIDEQVEGRYLLLTGDPGQGKSSLMAKLAAELSERGGCLLHMVKSTTSPRRFLKALISQAATLSEKRFGSDAYLGDIEELRESLVAGLQAVCERRGQAVLLIDALDELDDEGKLATFLPTALPDGVRVVLTCRPDIPLIQTLRARLSHHLDERAVKPFDLEDFQALLQDRLESSHLESILHQVRIETLFERVGPAPLFLIHFINDTTECWKQAPDKEQYRLDLDRVPDKQEALFEQIYNYIRELKDGMPTERGRQRERLLLLLCVAREALSLEELSDLTGVEGPPLRLGECRDRVQEMSQYVQDFGNGRYKPWHQGLVDHIRRYILGISGMQELESTFTRWLDRPIIEQGNYGLQYRVSHLLASYHEVPWLANMRGLIQGEFHHLDGYEHTVLVLAYLEELLRDPVQGLLHPSILDETVSTQLARQGNSLAAIPEPAKAITDPQVPWFGPFLDPVRGLLEQELTQEAVQLLKWCALLHDVGKPGTRVVEELPGGHNRVRFYGHEQYGLKLIEGHLKVWFPQAPIRERLRALIANHHFPDFLIGARYQKTETQYDDLLQVVSSGSMNHERHKIYTLIDQKSDRSRADLALLLMHSYAVRLATRGSAAVGTHGHWATVTLAILSCMTLIPRWNAEWELTKARNCACRMVWAEYQPLIEAWEHPRVGDWHRAVRELAQRCDGTVEEIVTFLRSQIAEDGQFYSENPR